MKNFALIGASGYIAPRHLKAIKETGNVLLCAFDPYDGVGIMDSFFPDSDFFIEFERFDRHVYKLNSSKATKLDFISICSPNYLHDSHIRFGIRAGSDVICEKPLVLNPWNLESLVEMEKDFDKRVYSILQLRLHADIVNLKRKVDLGPAEKIYDIDLTYITSRGNWYYTSWKGDVDKSGGIATNIGVHFFDMLTWIFGECVSMKVHLNSHDRASGFLQLERARVRWFLSVDFDYIPESIKQLGKRTFRSISVDGEQFEFSDGFTDLHTESYKAVINGEGFRINETANAIKIVHEIREKSIDPLIGDFHPFCKAAQKEHPFKRRV
jgi:UDP-N-acetyl-2-amino-2-deoxyglucuronate dehydrogenase